MGQTLPVGILLLLLSFYHVKGRGARAHTFVVAFVMLTAVKAALLLLLGVYGLMMEGRSRSEFRNGEPVSSPAILPAWLVLRISGTVRHI